MIRKMSPSVAMMDSKGTFTITEWIRIPKLHSRESSKIIR